MHKTCYMPYVRTNCRPLLFAPTLTCFDIQDGIGGGGGEELGSWNPNMSIRPLVNIGDRFNVELITDCRLRLVGR